MDDESLQEISFQIYPNPSEDQTTIHFTLLKPSQVCVKVFDVSGREIANPVSGWKPLLNDNLEQGDYSLPITTSYFAKGVYLVRISSDFGVTDAKLIVQ
jgi:hypothetical protein